MIKLIDVEKVYESGAGKTWVLRRINLDIREGEFVTIMGPSGAGKSTLMGIIGMLDGAWKGEYHLVEVMVIGLALPNLPAGIVKVVCLPSAEKDVPAMGWVPSDDS